MMDMSFYAAKRSASGMGAQGILILTYVSLLYLARIAVVISIKASGSRRESGVR